MKFTPKTCLNRHVRNRRDKWGVLPGLYPPSEPTRRVRSVSHPRKSPFGPFSGIGAAAATRVEIPKVNFAADGFGCSCSLVNAVTVTTPVGCANFGKLSCHYVDSAGLLRVKLVHANCNGSCGCKNNDNVNGCVMLCGLKGLVSL